MKTYNMVLPILITFLLLTSSGLTANYGNINHSKGNIKALNKTQIVRKIKINVIFVNYNKSLIDLNSIKNKITNVYENNLDFGIAYYHLDLNLTFASESLEHEIISFVNANKKNDTTSDLLEKKLENQLSLVESGHLGVRVKVFENNVTGYSISATKMEQFLNSLSPKTSESFYIYMLNLSYLDDHIKKQEHWFKVHEVDPDANATRSYWRLEWDNDLNKNVSFPYSAFTEKTRTIFVDPSSYNWYLTWARIWWGGVTDTPSNWRYYYDLDHLCEKLNFSNSGDVDKLHQYLAGWLNDTVDDLIGFSISVSLAGGNPYEKDISIQVKIFNTAENIININDLKWTVHPVLVKEAFNALYPRYSIDVQVDFVNISDYPEIKTALSNANISTINGWTYYSGYQLYYYLYSIRSRYFDLSKAKKVLTGWIFILYNASMVFGGKEFTGLGGRGNTMILMELHRILKEDLTKPTRGFTRVLVHELGHAIGTEHTFHSASHASDFAYDVMGYYPAAWNFSKIRRDTMLREIGDFRILKYAFLYDSLLFFKNISNFPEQVRDLAASIVSGINQADVLQNETKYVEANHVLDSVKEKLDLLSNVLFDKKPPTIEIISPKNGAKINSSNLVISLKANDDVKIYQIKVYLNDTLVYSGNETTINITLPSVGTYNITAWAYDYVGNNASTSIIIHYTKEQPPSNPWLSPITIIGVPSAIVVVALVLFLLYRKKG
ncbi:MAG: Ig-like domain-containing protein [Candidatus Njordarchaeia archaeon]